MSAGRTLVANLLESYAEDMAESESDPLSVARYRADAAQLRAGGGPSHDETRRILLDPTGPLVYTDAHEDVLLYMETVLKIYAKHQIWVNRDRTVMLRRWSDGKLETAVRDEAAEVWGPPMVMYEEKA